MSKDNQELPFEQVNFEMLVVLFRIITGNTWPTQVRMVPGELGLQRSNYKGGSQEQGPHYSWCRVVHGPEAGSRLTMLLWGLLELGEGEAPEPEREGRNKGFHWWMGGGAFKEREQKYLNLTLLPLSPFPQVPRRQEFLVGLPTPSSWARGQSG